MASFQVTGFIDTIKYNNGKGCFVFISEFKKGYKMSNGTIVDDKYLSWKCIFKQGLVKYINDHFSNGMLVEIKGEILPYAKDHDTIVEGYSVLGQTINIASYPRSSVKQEIRMIKESQQTSSGIPDLDTYNSPDY